MISPEEVDSAANLLRKTSLNTSITSNTSSSSGSANLNTSVLSQSSTQSSSSSPIDKLRTIKPFEEKQLLNFYQNELLDRNDKLVGDFVQRYSQKDRNEHYDTVVRLEKSLERFTETDQGVTRLIDSITELESKCWTAKQRTLKKSDRCSDGQLVEARHQFVEYCFDRESAEELEQRYYYVLKERLTNDQLVGQYQQKFYQLKFELMLWEMLEMVNRYAQTHANPDLRNEDGDEENHESSSDEPTFRLAKEQLQDWIAALFVYYRKTDNFNQQLKVHCYESLILLCQEYLKIASLEDRLFILNQILRCPSGSSANLALMIECPNPLPYRTGNPQYGKRLVDYSVTVICTILSPILDREKFIGHHVAAVQHSQAKNRTLSDSNKHPEPWLLVDTDFEDDLVNISPYEITEFDLINYLLRVPFEQVLEFMSVIEMPKEEEELFGERSSQFAQCTEIHMIKLFAFNTRLIRILRGALQNFNCLRFKELTMYIASMIKHIIRKISDQWCWCKEKFTTKDQALLVRLQVEFDSFMLRSIMAILSTNRRGVWPLLARIEFVGITEPMLWHILWVVYNNGLDDNAELSGLCPYMSANYWKDKFANYRQWKFVFLEKLSTFSVEEATGLMDFFYNMASSRDEKLDAEFLQEIIKRIAEICLLKKCYLDNTSGQESLGTGLAIQNQGFYLLKGNICLVNLLNQFKSLTTVLLQFITEQPHDEDNILVEPCLKLFESLLLEDFIPDGKFFYIVYGWLHDKPCAHLFSRIGRIVLSKLGWNRILLQSNRCLLLGEDIQQRHALKLYQAVLSQVTLSVSESNLNNKSNNVKMSILSKLLLNRKSIGLPNLLRLARSQELDDYIRWSWASLLLIRIHPLDLIPDESAWDEIVFGPSNADALRSSLPRRVNLKHRIFQQLPRLNYDTEMVSVAKALEAGEDQNAIAGYIALMMSDFVVKHSEPGKYLELCCTTLAKPSTTFHHLPLLNLLYHFVPLSLHHWESLRSNPKFITLVLDLIQNQYTDELCSVIMSQIKRFHLPENAAVLCTAWTEILYEAMHQALANAGRSGSWLSSFTPSVISGSSGTNNAQQLETILEQFVVIFDRLAQQIILSGGSGSSSPGSNDLFERYITYVVEKPYTKLSTSSSVASKLTSLVESPNQTTPLNQTTTQTSSSWSLFNLLPWSSSEESEIYYLPDRNVLKSEWCTPLHLLLRQWINRKVAREQRNLKSNIAKKFQRSTPKEDEPQMPYYLAFLLIEADMRKSARIWDHLVYLINDAELKRQTQTEGSIVDFEVELKNVCQLFDSPLIPYTLLPINSLIVWLLNATPPALDSPSTTPQPHPMLPLLWKSFFQLYFAHSGAGSSSVGLKFLNLSLKDRLQHRLSLLFDHHNRLWLTLNNQKASYPDLNSPVNSGPRQSDQISSLLFEDRLVKLFRAYRLWLQDVRLHSSFVNLDDDSVYSQPEFQSNILKYIFSAGSASPTIATTLIGSTSPMKNPLNEHDLYTTKFFFLNYVNRAKLEEDILCYESMYHDEIKRNDNTKAKKAPSPLPEDESDVARKRSNEKLVSRNSPSSLSRSSTKVKIVAPEDLKHKIGQYRQIIDYFTSLTSSIQVNLLFDDSPYLIEDPSREVDITPQDPSVIIVIIHQLIDTVMEEARFVESQLQKYGDLNRDFSTNILPKLFQNIRKELKKKISCERDEFDAAGCTGAAMIQFEFTESVLDQLVKQKYDRNRSEFASVLRALTKEVPVQKVVGSVYFLQKVLTYLLRFFDGDPSTESNQARMRQLLKSMTGWINLLNSVQSGKYFVTGQVLDQLLDTLSILSTRYMDQINYFLLETALQRNMSSPMIQQLAPCLSPAKCLYPDTFIEMYKLICANLMATPQQTVFVLLSKFDVSSWLQTPYVTDDQRLEFLNCLYQCLYLFGLTPTDEFLVTFDLYRKHMQDIILYRFPLFMQNILHFMLVGMSESKLAPTLWNSILHTFGFYTKSLSFAGTGQQSPRVPKSTSNNSIKSASSSSGSFKQSTLIDFDHVTFDLDLREYTHRQTILSSHELYELLQIMIEFHHRAYEELQTEFLDHFKAYASKYLQFVSFVSYCWISTNSTASTSPDDLSVVWRPYLDLWKGWILPKRTTKFILSDHLNFAWQLFINSLQFMIDSFAKSGPHRTSFFLSNVWQIFLQFIINATPETIEQKDVEMCESKLLQLNCWAQFDPNMVDIELMYESVIQNRYSVERFISYVISRINWPRTLSHPERRFTLEQLSNIVDNLSCVLIALSDQPYIAEIDLDSIPFSILNPNKVKQITLMLLPVMKQKMAKSGSTSDTQLSVFFKKASNSPSATGNGSTYHPEENVLLSLLRTVCDVQRNRASSPRAESPDFFHLPKNSLNDSWFVTKNLYYTNCVAALIGYYCNYSNDDGSSDGAKSSDQVRTFLQNWIDNMRATLDLLQPNDRLLTFDSILASINQITDDLTRKRLATNFVSVCSYALTSSTLLGDLIISINRTVQSVQLVVYLLECFTEIYLDLRGDLQFLVANLSLNLAVGKAISSSSSSSTSGKSSPTSTSSSEEPTASNTIIESIQSQASLLLLVHVYNRLSKSTVPEQCTKKYVCKLLEQSATFKPSAQHHDESKIILYFFKVISLLTSPSSGAGSDPVLDMLSHSESQFANLVSVSINQASGIDDASGSSGGDGGLSVDKFGSTNFFSTSAELFGSVQTLQVLCKGLHETISESLNRGWLFFRTQKHSSNWCLFLMESLVLHGVSTILELFYPDSVVLDYSTLFPTYSTISGSPSSSSLTDSLLRSSSTDSLISSSSSTRSSPSKSSVATSNSHSMLYSDSIRLKLKSELQDQLKASQARLMKTWKRDKSFTEIWPHIDQIGALYAAQLESLSKSLSTLAKNTRNMSSYEGDLDSLDGMSPLKRPPPPSEQEQQLLLIRKQFAQLQKKRFELIQGWIGTFYSDQNYIKSFL